MNWPTIIACIVGAISILGTVVTVTAVIISMKSSVNDLKVRDSERERDIKAADAKREKKDEEIDRQVIDLLVTLRGFMGSQTELNMLLKGFMEAQTNINMRMSGQLAAMEKASVEGTQVISLLTEVLKRGKILATGATPGEIEK